METLKNRKVRFGISEACIRITPNQTLILHIYNILQNSETLMMDRNAKFYIELIFDHKNNVI